MRRGAHAHDPISRIKSAKQIYTWIKRTKIIVCFGWWGRLHLGRCGRLHFGCWDRLHFGWSGRLQSIPAAKVQPTAPAKVQPTKPAEAQPSPPAKMQRTQQAKVQSTPPAKVWRTQYMGSVSQQRTKWNKWATLRKPPITDRRRAATVCRDWNRFTPIMIYWRF